MVWLRLPILDLARIGLEVGAAADLSEAHSRVARASLTLHYVSLVFIITLSIMPQHRWIVSSEKGLCVRSLLVVHINHVSGSIIDQPGSLLPFCDSSFKVHISEAGSSVKNPSYSYTKRTAGDVARACESIQALAY